MKIRPFIDEIRITRCGSYFTIKATGKDGETAMLFTSHRENLKIGSSLSELWDLLRDKLDLPSTSTERRKP